MIFRVLTLVAACAFFAAVLARENRLGNTEFIESRYLSWLGGNTETKTADPTVTFLRLENSESVSDSWPPGPLDYAILFDALAGFPPAVTAVVPTLAWPDPETAGIPTLAEKAAVLPSLVLGGTAVDNSGATPAGIPAFTDTLDTPIAVGGAAVALTSIDLGVGPALAEDGSAVLVPLLARAPDGTVVPTFPLAVVLASLGSSPDTLSVDLGESVAANGLPPVPIDRSGRLRVPLAMRDTITRVNADALYLPDLSLADPETVAAVEALPERVAVLGLDSPRDRRLAVPGGENLSEASVVAMAVATIQSGRYLRELAFGGQLAVWAAIAAAGVALLWLPRRRAFFAALLLVVVYLGVALVTFQATLVWWPFTVPAALLVTVLVLPVILPGAPAQEASAPIADGNSSEAEEGSNVSPG